MLTRQVHSACPTPFPTTAYVATCKQQYRQHPSRKETVLFYNHTHTQTHGWDESFSSCPGQSFVLNRVHAPECWQVGWKRRELKGLGSEDLFAVCESQRRLSAPVQFVFDFLKFFFLMYFTRRLVCTLKHLLTCLRQLTCFRQLIKSFCQRMADRFICKCFGVGVCISAQRERNSERGEGRERKRERWLLYSRAYWRQCIDKEYKSTNKWACSWVKKQSHDVQTVSFCRF